MVKLWRIDPISAFFERVNQLQQTNQSWLCIGLDPDPGRFPESVGKGKDAIFEFNRRIVDATSDLVCCYKPQIAHFASQGAEEQLQQLIVYIQDKGIPVILDAKRGDIGSTAEMYSIEAFDRYNADALTINPYLGLDAMAPFIDRADRGLLILCRTSNPGGADLQNLRLENGMTLYEHVATEVGSTWNYNENVGLVVGATQPAEMSQIRELCGDVPFLVPGIGAQGGDVKATIEAGQGGMLIISSSRAILYAGKDGQFDVAARNVALNTRDEINQWC